MLVLLQVIKCYPDEAASFASHVMGLLDTHYAQLDSALRRSLVQVWAGRLSVCVHRVTRVHACSLASIATGRALGRSEGGAWLAVGHCCERHGRAQWALQGMLRSSHASGAGQGPQFGRP